LTDPTKAVTLAAERDILAVMIQLEVPSTVVEQLEKGHKWVY